MAVHEDIMGKPTDAKRWDGTWHTIGYDNYEGAVAHRSEIEEKIGLSLAKNAELTNIAAKITKNVGARSYNQLGKQGQGKIDGEVDTFGGARAFKEGWGTLGASVFAVMNEIEQDGPTKTHYSTSHTENHPYFPTGEKKPEFDEPLASLNWEDLPKGAKQSLAGDDENVSPFTKLPASTYNELDFKGKLTLLKGFRYSSTTAQTTATTLKNELAGSIPEPIKNALKDLKKLPAEATDEQKNKARTKLRTQIKEAMKGDFDEDKAKLSAFLDIVVDRHTSGDNTNIVQFDKDKNGHEIDNEKNRWIHDTVKAGKPIISGPSGHTLRYLNFWAEKRNEADPSEVNDTKKWPSLEAARLVMMANLMPPKHHSYDEIMTASIGIKDNTSSALNYSIKTSYGDLNVGHDQKDAKHIAQQAYKDAKAIDAATNLEAEDEIRDSIKDRKDYQATKAAILQGIESLFINPTANYQKITAIKGQLSTQ